jgi:hypothetical protein
VVDPGISWSLVDPHHTRVFTYNILCLSFRLETSLLRSGGARVTALGCCTVDLVVETRKICVVLYSSRLAKYHRIEGF